MYLYNGCTKDPLYRLVKVPHCIGQLALLTLPLNIWRMMVGEKGKLIFLLPRPAAIYRDCDATSDIFSVHAGTCTLFVQSIHEHSMYSITSML
jgi:hypothetical protein